VIHRVTRQARPRLCRHAGQINDPVLCVEENGSVPNGSVPNGPLIGDPL